MLYLQLFHQEYITRSPLRGIIKPRDIDYLRRLYHYNQAAISKYYRDRDFAAKNTNIISRLLEHVDTNLSYPVDRYTEIIRSRIDYLGKYFKFTSEIEKGDIHIGSMFGKDNEEIILAIDEYFNPYEVEKNWKTSEVVKVYKHDINDLKLLLPSGKVTGSRTGVCSLSINLPKLAVMYRCFNREQRNNELLGNPTLNKNYFVYKYVYSNNLKSIIDHTFLNKIMDKFYNREEVIPKFKHPFKIYEPTKQVDRYIGNTLDVITNKNLDFLDIMHNIQLMFNESALDLLSLPEITPTRQVNWAIIISRLDHMLFLLDVGGKSNTNRQHVNDFKRACSRLTREITLDGVFTYEREKDIKEKIYRIANW